MTAPGGSSRGSSRSACPRGSARHHRRRPTRAVPLSRPTPGTLISRRTSADCRACARRSRSIAPIRCSSSWISAHKAARTSRSGSVRGASASLSELLNPRYDLPRADRDHEPELAQHSTHRVDPGRSCRHPPRSDPMERSQRLLLFRLDRHRLDVVVPQRLQNALGVGPVGLVAGDVGPDRVRRQQQDPVPGGLDPPAPVVRAAARLHRHRRLRPPVRRIARTSSGLAGAVRRPGPAGSTPRLRRPTWPRPRRSLRYNPWRTPPWAVHPVHDDFGTIDAAFESSGGVHSITAADGAPPDGWRNGVRTAGRARS